MSDIGRRIAERRTAAVLSQGDLAKRAGVAVITINRIENGHGDDPRPSTVRKIAKALEVDPRWLMFGEMSDG